MYSWPALVQRTQPLTLPTKVNKQTKNLKWTWHVIVRATIRDMKNPQHHRPVRNPQAWQPGAQCQEEAALKQRLPSPSGSRSPLRKRHVLVGHQPWLRARGTASSLGFTEPQDHNMWVADSQPCLAPRPSPEAGVAQWAFRVGEMAFTPGHKMAK